MLGGEETSPACDHGLPRRPLRVSPQNALGWKITVMTKLYNSSTNLAVAADMRDEAGEI